MVSKNNTIKFLLFLVLVFLFLFLSKYFNIDEEWCKSFLGDFPLFLSGLIFIFLYVVLTFFIWIGPKDVLRITSALIFGAYISTVLVSIGELCNVVLLFSLSRKLGRGYVEEKLRGKMQRLDQTIAGTSFFGIFFLRLFPVVPFRFLDLGFGLTKISLRKYFMIALLSTPSRVFFLQFFLSLGMDVAMNPGRLQAYLNEHPLVMQVSFIYLVGAIVMMFFWKRKVSKKERGV